MPGVLQYHALMLGDAVRNKLLAKAIKQNVTKDTSFLDIGAGTGVWAIYAATLGAKRVVAVEMEECLIPIIFKHAEENGVADRIEIIHGKSDDVKIRGRFDVIVSELFGGDALGAETITSFIDVRTRFLAPGGVLIPQELAMFAAPAHIAGPAGTLPAGLTLKSDFLQAIKLNYPQNMTVIERDRIKFLDEPIKIAETGFRTVTEPPSLANLTASWQLKDMSKANAIAIFNRSTFADGGPMGASPFSKKKGNLFSLPPKKKKRKSVAPKPILGQSPRFSPPNGKKKNKPPKKKPKKKKKTPI